MLKVWCGYVFGYSKTNNASSELCIVAAHSQKKAVELLEKCKNPMSVGYFSKYWSKTNNELQLKTATEIGVWVDTGTAGQSVYSRFL